MKAVRFDHYGPADVLTVLDVDDPGFPGPDEVLIEVRAVALNGGDTKVRRGRLPIRPLPAGLGRECSGVIAAVGDNVSELMVGQSVIASHDPSLQERVRVAAHLVTPRPHGLTWEQAACLTVAGQTAWVAAESQAVQPHDIVVVSGAAGGVGTFLCQLLLERGATVIGLAGAHHHDYLESLGVLPLQHGPYLAGRLEAMSPQGIHRVFDLTGPDVIEAGLELGVPRERINSLSGFGELYGVPTVGRQGLNPDIIDEIASRMLSGRLALPITTFPFDETVKAFVHFEETPTRGKVVVVTD